MSQKKSEKGRFPGRRDSKNKVSGRVTSSVLEYRVQGRMVKEQSGEGKDQTRRAIPGGSCDFGGAYTVF